MTSNKVVSSALRKRARLLKKICELFDEGKSQDIQLIHFWKNGKYLICGEEFQKFSRMTIDKFETLFSLVGSKIEKRDTAIRCAISSRLRLAITLRYIATDDSFRSLEFLARISRKTISAFVPEVLQAIVIVLQNQYMKTPTTKTGWHSVANDFESLWQFPHTLGAIDGKHIRIKAPPHSGSDFFNYKGFFNIVLLGVVDVHSRFIYVDVSGNGRASDVLVYKSSTFYEALKTGKLNLPTDEPLKSQVTKTPFFFIGDDIFGLNPHLLKAYNRNSNLSSSQEAFNYRLSRSRITVEMAFGRLVSRFRIFHRPIEVSVKTCDLLVKACCILHNYLPRTLEEQQMPGKDNYQQNMPGTISSLPTQDQDTCKYACQIRENVRKYCIIDGDLPY